MNRPQPLWSQTPFLRLWLSSVLSNAALAVALLAETWYLVKHLDAEASLGLVLVAGSVPRFFLMAVGGVAADRWPRVAICANSLVLRALLSVLAAALLWAGHLGVAALAVFALLYGALDAFFWPARDALLPGVVLDQQQLLQANSVMLSTNQLGQVLGPALGGLMLAVMSFEAVFAWVGVALLLGALCLWGMRDAHARAASVDAPVEMGWRVWLGELNEGLKSVLHHPVLRHLMLIYAPANLFFIGPLTLGLPLLAAKTFGGSATDLSLLESAFAAGMIAGGAIMAWRSPRNRRLAWIALMIALEGAALVALPHSPTVWWAAAVQVVLGLGVAFNNAPMMALLQQHADRDKLGRVMGLNSMIGMGLSPVSQALVAFALALSVSIHWVMGVSGLLLALTMLAMWRFLPVVRDGN